MAGARPSRWATSTPRSRRMFVRDTHPLLWRCYITLGLISVGLGLNFLLADKPPFTGYDVNVRYVGTIFLTLGLARLFFLLVYKRRTLLRLTIACAIGFTIWWGIGTAITFFRHNPETGLRLTTLQLAVLYTGMAALDSWLLIESPVTVTTEPTK